MPLYVLPSKCIAGNVIPPEKIVSTLSHKTFVVHTYFGNIRDSSRGNASTAAALQWYHGI